MPSGIKRLRVFWRTLTSPSGHSNLDTFLGSLDGDSTLLDYRAFERFVEDTPLKRGRAFSGLLGLGQLSEYRQALQTLSHGQALNNDYQLDTLHYQRVNADSQSAAALKTVRVAYAQLVGVPPDEPLDSDLTAARAVAVLSDISLVKPHVEGKSLSEVEFATVRAVVHEAEGSAKRVRLSDVLKEIAGLTEFAAAEGDNEAQQSLKELLKERDTVADEVGGIHFQHLYEAARDLLEDGQWSDAHSCPLCKSRELEPGIAEQVAEHLAAFGVLKDTQRRICSEWSTAAWVDRLKKLAAKWPATDGHKASDLDETFRLGEPGNATLAAAVRLLDDLEGKRQSRISALETEKEALEESLPPSLVTLTEQVTCAEQLQDAIGRYKRASTRARELSQKLGRRRKWVSFIQRASAAFADAEVLLSTARTVALESQYRNLYREITQNPEIVPLLKKAPGSEELHLRLEAFYGLSNLSAPSLLPESYRNALAISIFFSAARRTSSQARFMVLDDITSSFDAGHQFSVMEALRTTIGVPADPDGPQVIILSHDGLLEKYFDSVSHNQRWHHQKLQGLPPTGNVFCQAQRADRLRVSAEKLLKAGQAEEASSLVRQYLEFSLLRIISRVSISVPFNFSIRDDRKMMKNSLDAIKEAIELHKRAGQLILSSAQVEGLEKVLVPALLSNWVAHYATGRATSVSPYVLLGILDTMDEVDECFRYVCGCSGIPVNRYYSSLAKKGCSC